MKRLFSLIWGGPLCSHPIHSTSNLLPLPKARRRLRLGQYIACLSLLLTASERTLADGAARLAAGASSSPLKQEGLGDI